MKKFVSLMLAIVMAAMLTVCLPTAALAEVNFTAEPMDDAELKKTMGEYYDRCIGAACFEYGAIALMEGDEIGYFAFGNTETVWNHATDVERDIFFRVGEGYPDAGYDLCAYAGNDVLSFRSGEMMEIEMTNVWTYDFGEDYLYFISIDGGALTLWTPYAHIILATDGVYDAVVNRDYLLFSDAHGGHVVNARMSDICKKTQAYLSYHMPPIIDMGNVEIWDYYPELYWYDEYGLVDNTADFNNEFGINFDAWGSSKHDFSLDDFATYVSMPINGILNTFDIPLEMYEDPFTYPDITFNGHSGYLQFYRASDFELKSIYWYDNEGTPGLIDELCKLVEDAGGKLARTDVLEGYGVEYVYKLNGRYIHVGYTDENGPTSYIYAYNPNTYDE